MQIPDMGAFFNQIQTNLVFILFTNLKTNKKYGARVLLPMETECKKCQSEPRLQSK